MKPKPVFLSAIYQVRMGPREIKNVPFSLMLNNRNVGENLDLCFVKKCLLQY